MHQGRLLFTALWNSSAGQCVEHLTTCKRSHVLAIYNATALGLPRSASASASTRYTFHRISLNLTLAFCMVKNRFSSKISRYVKNSFRFADSRRSHWLSFSSNIDMDWSKLWVDIPRLTQHIPILKRPSLEGKPSPSLIPPRSAFRADKRREELLDPPARSPASLSHHERADSLHRHAA